MGTKLKPWLRFIEGEEGGGAEGVGTVESTDDNGSTDDTSGDASDSDDSDWKSKYESMRAEMRKQEQRAKENKAAADRLKEIENEGKPELERLREAQAESEKRAAEAERQVLRYKVAAENGLSSEDAELLLTADDEDAMTAQAKRLAELAESKKKRRTPGDDRDRTPPAPTLKSGADLYDRVKANLY